MAMNLKIYLPTLLFLFLLVDKPVSCSRNDFWKPIREFGEKVLQVIAENAVEDVLKNWMNQNGAPPPPTGGSSPPQVIQGLRFVKAYLYNYGYIKRQSYPPYFTDSMDEEMESAIKKYQGTFNLPTTGNLDMATCRQMLQPRCGVPDMNPPYVLGTNPVSWPGGTNWFPNPRTLTYGFDPSTNPYAMNVFRSSFQLWSSAIRGLNLLETTFDDAIIKIGFYDLDQRAEVVGRTILERQAEGGGNNVGVIILDGGNWKVLGAAGADWRGKPAECGDAPDWASSWAWPLPPLRRLGYAPCVFYPSQQTKVQFSNSDMQQIQQLYSSGGDGGGSVISYPLSAGDGGGHVGSSWGFLNTLSLGFSCMVLFLYNVAVLLP